MSEQDSAQHGKLARRARGFSLLELLTVVFILAVLGGGMLVAYGNLQASALNQTAHMEMQKIKQALLMYKQDMGDFPAPAHPADFSALYEQGGQPAWDLASGRGWRGPYLTRFGEGRVDIGDDLQNDGSGSPVAITVAAHVDQWAVADPFLAPPARGGGSYAACEETPGNSPNTCLLDWRSAPNTPTHTRWGRPYLLFEMNDPARARLVSMGPDGRYAGVNAGDPCAPQDDDLVLCLSR